MKSLITYLNESQNKEYVDIFVVYNDKILFLRRANYIRQFGGKWCLPGGTLEKGEDQKEAIIRELKEETNISVKDVQLWRHWTYSNNSKTSIYTVILDNEPDIKISREHAQYKWLSVDELEKYREKMAGELWSIVQEKFLSGKIHNDLNRGV